VSEGENGNTRGGGPPRKATDFDKGLHAKELKKWRVEPSPKRKELRDARRMNVG